MNRSAAKTWSLNGFAITLVCLMASCGGNPQDSETSPRPTEDMVVVFRADPGGILDKWIGGRVKPQESFLLIPKILSAKEAG